MEAFEVGPFVFVCGLVVGLVSSMGGGGRVRRYVVFLGMMYIWAIQHRMYIRTFDPDRRSIITGLHQSPEEDWDIGHVAFCECRRVLLELAKCLIVTINACLLRG